MSLARCPGKLMIAGEYSVLRPGGAALALAVDAPLEVSATPGDADRVTSEALGLTDVGPGEDPRLSFIAEALAVARRVAPVPPLTLGISGRAGQVDGRGAKLGFGSSAAVTVATIGAALAGRAPLSRDRLFRLAALAHSNAQGRAGSGYDVATQVLGGVVLYRPPAAERWRATPDALTPWLDVPWPEHSAERLPWPEGLFLTACWVGQGASTRGMMFAARAEAEEHLDAMASRTRDVIRAWREGRVAQILPALDAAEDALRRWDAASGTGAVTSAVRDAVDLARAAGCAGRTSGAGGGDCVLAFASEEGHLDAARSAWSAAGLRPITITPDWTGAEWSPMT